MPAPVGSANERGGAAAAGAAAGAVGAAAAASASWDPATDYPIWDAFDAISGYWVHRDRAAPFMKTPVQEWNNFSIASYNNFFRTGAGGPPRTARGTDAAAGAAQPSPAGMPPPPPAPGTGAGDIRREGYVESGKPDPRYRNPAEPPPAKGQSKNKNKGKSSKDKQQNWGQKGKSSKERPQPDSRGGYWDSYNQGSWYRGGW